MGLTLTKVFIKSKMFQENTIEGLKMIVSAVVYHTLNIELQDVNIFGLKIIMDVIFIHNLLQKQTLNLTTSVQLLQISVSIVRFVSFKK